MNAPAKIKEPVVSHEDEWEPQNTLRAFDVLSNPMMIADAKMVIRYVNPAAIQMFQAIEVDIKKDLPHFSAADVIGKSIDYFHKNPSYQRGIMDALRKPHDGKFKVGGKSLAFRATPNFNAEEKLASVFVEWQDLTAAIADKVQMDTLIDRVRDMAVNHNDGMISVRVSEEGLGKVFLEVGQLVNTMVEGHISTKKKVVECLNAFANGDFDYEVEAFSGERSFLNEAIEASRTAFKDVISEIEGMSHAIAGGNLDVEISPDDFKGGYRSIIEAFERLNSSLNTTISRVKDELIQVKTAVDEVSMAAGNLSHASQTQASAVEQISSSLEETDAIVQSNAAASDSMLDVVNEANTLSEQGITTIAELTSAMDEIQVSSESISKIIKVIDEIAFQTNLLSLNAAVEAARAGEHGRGFAVVSQEVRNLAQRSAKAARESAELIEKSTAQVQRGVKSTTASEAAFQKISGEIAKIKDAALQIARSSREQATGVTQISQAIAELAATGAEVASQSEELASSSTQMQSSVGLMDATLSTYKVKSRQQDMTTKEALDRLGISQDMLEQVMRQKSMPVPNGRVGSPTAGAAKRNASDMDPRGFGRF